MATIAENARIIMDGKVKSVRAVVEAVVTTCALEGCDTPVGKVGNTCSMTCYTAVHAIVASTPKTTVKVVIEPTDAGDQAKALVANHLLWHVAQDQRVKHSAAAHLALKALLEDPTYATADGQDLADLVIGTYTEYLPYVQAPKAVIEATPKVAVRKPRTAKHQPRITDNKEHPVTEKITMTKAEMERAIAAAADALVAERMAVIKATPVVAPQDKPVEVVGKKGGRVKVQRATAKDREYIGTVLPAIVVNEALTIPALEVGEESIDTLASPKVRSPYNKARYRLDKTPTPLDKETTTFRSLIAEHLRIATLVGTSTKAAKTPKVAAVVEPTKKAKVSKKVKALMDIMGCTEAEALAAVGK